MRNTKEQLPRSNEQAWANGCAKCKFGIATAPDILGAFPFVEGRAVQADEGLVEFCDCRAGFMHRQGLRKIYNTLSMELRRNVLEHISALTPTVHGELA